MAVVASHTKADPPPLFGGLRSRLCNKLFPGGLQLLSSSPVLPIVSSLQGEVTSKRKVVEVEVYRVCLARVEGVRKLGL